MTGSGDESARLKSMFWDKTREATPKSVRSWKSMMNKMFDKDADSSGELEKKQ